MTRRCAEKGCPTILSRYNDEPKCHIHALPRFRGVARDGRQRRKDELEGKYPIEEDGPRCRMTGCDSLRFALELCERHYRARRRVLEKLGRTG